VASYGSSRVSTSGLSAGHFDDTMKYSDRHLAGLSAKASRPRRTHRRGLSRLPDHRPQLRLRAEQAAEHKSHCERRDFLLVFKNINKTTTTHKKSPLRTVVLEKGSKSLKTDSGGALFFSCCAICGASSRKKERKKQKWDSLEVLKIFKKEFSADLPESHDRRGRGERRDRG